MTEVHDAPLGGGRTAAATDCDDAPITRGTTMRRSVILTAIVTSVVSTTLTALVMLALLPAVVTAQVERLSTAGLTIVRADGLAGL
jgi:hypothetical protein